MVRKNRNNDINVYELLFTFPRIIKLDFQNEKKYYRIFYLRMAKLRNLHFCRFR